VSAAGGNRSKIHCHHQHHQQQQQQQYGEEDEAEDKL